MHRLSEFFRVRALFLFIVISFSQNAFPQLSPVSFEGGVDTHLYKSDTVMIEATAIYDDSGYLDGGSLSTGLMMFHSPFLSALYVPVKYGLTDNFSLSFSLPYLTKTLVYNDNHYIKNAYGDIALGLSGSFKPFRYFSGSTTVRGTLPTGNANAQEDGCFIPMGYGGYTGSVQQSFSIGAFDAGFISFRLFVSGIGICYFKSSREIDAVTKNNFEKAYAWSGMGGIDIGLGDSLNIEVKGNYIRLKEREYRVETDPPAPSGTITADDSVKQINIIPVIKYRFLDDVSGLAGIIYPLKTTLDSHITKVYDARWKIVMGIEKRFRAEDSSDVSGMGKYPLKKNTGFKDPAAVEENVKDTDAVEEKAVSLAKSANSANNEEKTKKTSSKRKSKKRKRR